MSKGKLFVISGASGVGKSTVLKAVMEQRNDLRMLGHAVERDADRLRSGVKYGLTQEIEVGAHAVIGVAEEHVVIVDRIKYVRFRDGIPRHDGAIGLVGQDHRRLLDQRRNEAVIDGRCRAEALLLCQPQLRAEEGQRLVRR